MMEIDTPATLFVIGAGPVGIEAALYARFLGYDVKVFERGQVGASLRQASALPMSASFAECCSTLGLAALKAHHPQWEAPPNEAVVSRGEFLERYLLPLSRTDLLDGGIVLETEIMAVRTPAAVLSPENSDEQGDEHFSAGPICEVVLRDAGGNESTATAEAVIDCRGPAASDSLLAADASRPTAERVYVLGRTGGEGGREPCIAVALEQIRRLFAVLGGRESLDLYHDVKRLA